MTRVSHLTFGEKVDNYICFNTHIMKKSHSPFNLVTHWKISGSTAMLYAGETLLLELHDESSKRTTFKWNDKVLAIKNEGLWNPKVVVSDEDNVIAMLKRFLFKSKAEISFGNDVRYYCKIKNTPLVTFVFYDLKGEKVLHYKIDASVKPKSLVKIFDNSLPEDELVMLLAIGFYTFKNIVKENDDANLITIVAAAG